MKNEARSILIKALEEAQMDKDKNFSKLRDLKLQQNEAEDECVNSTKRVSCIISALRKLEG